MEEERFVDAGMQSDDISLENSLRPHNLKEYIGQDTVKESLSLSIEAALKRHEPLDHMLLYGPPGLGKTTLSAIVASEMGQNIRVTSGPAIERPGDLASILANLNEGDVLFIDEIHRLSRSVEEVLYPAMEDFAIDIMLGKGPTARSIRVAVPHFTLVGATTRFGQLSAPLRDRFGMIYRLELYTPDQLAAIVTRSANILKVKGTTPDGMMEIAKRSRGTPRVANRMLKRARDYAEVRGDGTITRDAANAALKMEGVDDLGLDKTDRNMLLTGLPVSILQWAAILLWIFKGIWWLFPVWAIVAIIYGVTISRYYYRSVAYICPQCHEVFKPAFKEMFWAKHTPKTRKLTCVKCGHHGYCVETWAGEAK